MKVQVAVSLCVLAIISAAFFFSSTSVRRPVPLEVAEAYSRWVQEFGKLYATPAERDYRLSVFYDQWVSVEQSNQEYELAAAAAGQTLTGPMFAINGFSDLTIEEFGARYTGLQLPEELEVFEEDQSPAETQGLTASNLGAGYSIVIKSQGGCGSCWAFSAVAALEKYYYDKQKTRVDLSQQELVTATPAAQAVAVDAWTLPSPTSRRTAWRPRPSTPTEARRGRARRPAAQ